jgi:hypothetical protein
VIAGCWGIFVSMAALALWARLVLADAHLTAFASKAVSVFVFFPFSIDHWLSRILPWPMDFRVEIEGFNLVSTPFLSAPVNVVGLLLLAGLIVSEARTRSLNNRRSIFTALIMATIVTSFLLSLPFGSLEQAKMPDGSPAFGVLYSSETSWRTFLLGRVQFGYRLVNIVNAAIIFGFLVLVATRRDQAGNGIPFANRASLQRLALAAATLCFVGAGVKLTEVYREYELLPAIAAKQKVTEPASSLPIWARGIYAWVSPDNLSRLRAALAQTGVVPQTEYGFGAYAMPSLFPNYREGTQFPLQPVELKAVNSVRAAVAVSCLTSCALSTGLFPSPYFRIDVNGAAVSPRLLRTLKQRVVILIPQAGDYTVTVHLGTWATTAYGYAVAALVVTFWLSGLMAIGLSPAATGSSRSPKIGDIGPHTGPEESRGA